MDCFENGMEANIDVIESNMEDLKKDMEGLTNFL